MIDGSVKELLIEPPSLENFFSKKQFSTLKYTDELIEHATHLLSLEELTYNDELVVEEVFDLLSDDGFRFLCPIIMQAYIDGVFKFDGNLAERFEETIWFAELCNDRKFGRGKRADIFARYRASLSSEANQNLTSILKQLGKLAGF